MSDQVSSKIQKRHDGRGVKQLRAVSVTPDIFEHAPGSLLFELGKTKILCAVSMQPQVPSFLKGKREGWLTCEYAMLPMSTHTRTQRESNLAQKNGRSVEISRFLGRVLRTVVDTSAFPDHTIIVDCDVLQADGGTRVASVTAASLALLSAQSYWLEKNIITKNIVKEMLYGISVGIVQNAVFLDLSYVEDSKAQSDFNIVLTESGKLVEILGGSETDPISLDLFSTIQSVAVEGVEHLKKEIQVAFDTIDSRLQGSMQHEKKTKKAPLFSLQKRLFENKEL